MRDGTQEQMRFDDVGQSIEPRDGKTGIVCKL
jgi:uncharacterized protein YkvS